MERNKTQCVIIKDLFCTPPQESLVPDAASVFVSKGTPSFDIKGFPGAGSVIIEFSVMPLLSFPFDVAACATSGVVTSIGLMLDASPSAISGVTISLPSTRFIRYEPMSSDPSSLLICVAK